jgi:16S rRNA (cytosine967-C5)-methyltransferase
MTPAARVAAAIECLDLILAGSPAEKVMTSWARGNRYAGSKDRAAVRDHVYDGLRCRRSFAAVGGAETGRGMMIGAGRLGAFNLDEMFNGQGYGPTALTKEELSIGVAFDTLPVDVQGDVPAWIYPQLEASLGNKTKAVLAKMRARAPVYLRVNLRKSTRNAAQEELLQEGIETVPHPTVSTALEVKTNPRRVQQSLTYLDGIVELQDASSQAVAAQVDIKTSDLVLDYCAGGGGKTLALAGLHDAQFFAHDLNAQRLRDLPGRAERAGVKVQLIDLEDIKQHAGFNVIFCDVPCSGSGAWRRAPDGKWRLDAVMLDDVLKTQAQILHDAASVLQPNGELCYTTCSLIAAENALQVARFLAERPEFTLKLEMQLTPLDDGDGFYCAILKHNL